MTDFQQFLLTRVSSNTLLTYLKNISGALNELVRKQVISRNPLHDVPKHDRLRRKDEKRTAWTLDQLQLLANTPCNIKPQFKEAYFFACFTGLRWSEVNGLTWANIIRKRMDDVEQWFVHFEQQKTESVEYFPLSDQAIDILKRREANREGESSYVFPLVKETKSYRVHSKVNYALKKWAKAAGLDHTKMRFHTTSAPAKGSLGRSMITIEYESLVTSMLGHAGIYLFEENIISRYNNLSLPEILAQNEHFVHGPNRPNPHKEGKFCPTYYDTAMPLFITSKNKFYPEFFAYFFKHADLLKVDQFLDYQLERHHAGDVLAFTRLLVLLFRKYERVVIPEKMIDTIHEWIDAKTTQQKRGAVEPDDSGSNGKKRGRINRRAEDNITSLNREQTILFIQYVKDNGVCLKDEYLTDVDAGKAFELLTGFSQHTLRQDLGKFYQFQNKENLEKLHQTFSRITRQIENAVKIRQPRLLEGSRTRQSGNGYAIL